MASGVTTFAGVPTTSTFVYDGDGRRVKKIDGATTTRYLSKLYECETTGANTSCSRFIWANDTRIATVATNGAVHYWHGDHLGSSSVITDSTGAKVQALTYYPYGDLRTNQSLTTPAINVPYKFTGKELDASSNLYFYEARYYHAVFGRFIAPDPIVPYLRDPQSLNRYTYARNNPLLYKDPTGHFFAAFMGLGSLFGIGGGAAAATSALTSVSAVNHAVATAAANEVRRGIDSVVRNRAYSFNPYRSYLDFERALLIGPVGFGIDSLTGGNIADAQQTRVAGYVRSGYLVTATAVAAIVCGGCTLQSIGPILQTAYMGAAVGTSSGVAQAAITGEDPSQAAVMGALLGAVGGATGGAFTQYAAPYLMAQLGNALPFSAFESARSILAGTGIESVVAKFGGAVIGSSVGGGLKAFTSGTNIAKGVGIGALGGVFSGAMALTFNPALTLHLGEGTTRQFIDGAVDWTGGWFSDEAQDNK